MLSGTKGIKFQVFLNEKMEPEWERILLQVTGVELMKMFKNHLAFIDFGRSGDRLHGHRFSKQCRAEIM